MKLDKLLRNNVFLINSSICLVLLLTFCYLDQGAIVKKTYSATIYGTSQECENSCSSACKVVEDGFLCEDEKEIERRCYYSPRSSTNGNHFYWWEPELIDYDWIPVLGDANTYEECSGNISGKVIIDFIAEIEDGYYKPFSVKREIVDPGTTITFPSSFVSGYEVDFWYIDGDNVYIPGDTYVVNENVTFTGYLSLEPPTTCKVNLIYDENYTSEIQCTGDYIVLPRYIKTGYNHIGWYDLNGNFVLEAGGWYLPYGDITLKAEYTAKTYTISYDANGGTNAPSNQTINYDEKLQFLDNNPTRDGYVFIGWNTKSDGTGTSYNSGDVYNIDADATFYAQWEKTYEISSDYKVDEEHKYIIVDFGVTKANLENKITLGTGYKLSIDTKTVDNKTVLYTGGKVKILKSDNSEYVEYTAVVLGDVDGDGDIHYVDYVELYNHIQKEKNPDLNLNLLTGAKLKAADMYEDGDIHYTDYVTIYNKIQELKAGNN